VRASKKLCPPDLQLEQAVLAGALDEGVVAVAALVRHAGQRRVAFLHILTHHLQVATVHSKQQDAGSTGDQKAHFKL
jgi:hypothetical protein